MPKPRTALDRLSVLLPWLNGGFDTEVRGPRTRPEDVLVRTDYAHVRQVIDDFIQSFDGSAGAGHLQVVGPARPSQRKPATDEELEELGATLLILLEEGIGDTSSGGLSVPATSLGFWIRGVGRTRPRTRGNLRGAPIDGGTEALRDYRAAGAYVLQVTGAMVELVPFLVAHLLTQPDMVMMRRCRRLGCPHFVITAPNTRGRPRVFCSVTCRALNAEQEARSRTKRKG